ncbi:hypothetical protein KL86DPRO_10454 [uncultured delta proteobacterium]|uniref:Uncharacterized protein n=1 Tax=uncultured delta proteobacterium TaxID=34034 RepID=A0A212J0W5_9DELT|nr:hypothetical protein KL86DPRO_10454 [uncultured delta proteobacterium]
MIHTIYKNISFSVHMLKLHHILRRNIDGSRRVTAYFYKTIHISKQWSPSCRSKNPILSTGVSTSGKLHCRRPAKNVARRCRRTCG